MSAPSGAGISNREVTPYAILDTLRNVLGTSPVPALHEPVFRGREWEYLKDCLDTTLVSSVGPYVDRIERTLEEITGAKRAVAVVNGTAALHVCLLLAGVRAEDEVLIPSLTFVATANAVMYCSAIPHLVDVDEATLGVDPAKLADHLRTASEMRGGECRNRATGRRIKALMPMHAFGHPVDLDPLLKVCAEYGLVMIEDAAEALGSRYRGRHVGQSGMLSALSFNGNKIVTTGGGGAVLTNDEGLGKEAKHLTTTAKLPHKWAFFHDRVGYNYRMPNLNAALGCAQLEQLPGFLAAKRRLADRYMQAFSGFSGVEVFREKDFATSNYWLNGLLLAEKNSGLRDETLALGDSAGIALRAAWVPMHRLPMYSNCPRMDLQLSESIERRLISLPSGVGLG